MGVFNHIDSIGDDKKNNPKGYLQMTYKYGQLLIPKSKIAIYRLYANNKSVFIDYYTYWPVSESFKNKRYNQDDVVRILFEIELGMNGTPFKDLYALKSSYQERGQVDMQPTRFVFQGLEGYNKSPGSWYYVAVKPSVLTPQGTPLTFSCRDDIGSETKGSCRTHLIFDEHLRVQIRFNKHLLSDWSTFYNQLIALINQYRQ